MKKGIPFKTAVKASKSLIRCYRRRADKRLIQAYVDRGYKVKYAKAYLKKHGNKWKLIPVGSVARRQKIVKDLDFITPNPISLNNKKRYHARSNIVIDGYTLWYDVWYIPEKDLKIASYIRTYPKHYIIAIRKGLEKKGYKLTDKQLLNKKTGRPVHVKSFKQIIKKSGVKYHPISYYYEI